MKNNIRFDLSDYLIHFFRDVDLQGKNYIHFPEHCGFNNLAHSDYLDARFLLRCAIRHCKISASWSFRGAVRTIYGESPAVCFTDMPVSAFVKTSVDRLNMGENIGLYALLLPKADMFKVGARPVIYGLDGFGSNLPSGYGGGKRIINPNLLPLNEQYRYVTYVPGSIDWTHEREWRWPFRGNMDSYEDEIKEDGQHSDFENTPGLELECANLKGAGVIVPKNRDVKYILNDLLTLIDRNVLSRDSFTFIISTENLSSYTDIVDPISLSHYINNNLLDIDKFYDFPWQVVENFGHDVGNIISSEWEKYLSSCSTQRQEFGRAWVWLLDNKSDLTRALLEFGIVEVSKEGRYLLDLGHRVRSSLDLSKQEEFACIVANELNQKYGVLCSYFSVLNSDSCDDIPYYAGYHDEKHEFFNSTLRID
ncbi:DUF4427 domain-containing protein [Vibrio fluvialis]|nr:DUF4427 domain-containing protein [Vibrio fluvialis]MBY8257470.1 DUF4427 domain-containing protein [Vibrio fluvialis]MBY8266024.1 DUF4427 domain-containing protein [Vibrio fluvialis]